MDRERVIQAIIDVSEGLFGHGLKREDLDTSLRDIKARHPDYPIDSLDEVELIIETEDLLDVYFDEKKLVMNDEMTFNQLVDMLIAAKED
jgi:acyl carrier protein